MGFRVCLGSVGEAPGVQSRGVGLLSLVLVMVDLRRDRVGFDRER